jgi:hypothetical protein
MERDQSAIRETQMLAIWNQGVETFNRLAQEMTAVTVANSKAVGTATAQMATPDAVSPRKTA